ncbi:MAG: Sap, sulfolipid-addressing protein [Solirubrobacterales bacterium]|nr:Sap, sulfolipid-addressing protein [Solirubrobacterales bacterium]
MAELLAKTLPLMLAAASNPAVIGIVVLALTSADRPLTRAASFVAGFAVVLALVGLAGFAFFRGSRETFGPGGSLFAWLDIALGAGMLALAGITWARRDSGSDPSRLLGRVSPAAFFGVGAIFMISDASALVALVPLLRDVAVADVSSLERLIALVITWVVVILPIAAPVLVYVWAPRSSQRALAAIRGWLDRYGYLVAIAVFGAIGIYLLVRGISRV